MQIENISVIIPSYNNLRHLKNCYESLKKHAPNVEICIADDASTDGTLEWLNSLSDNMLKYIRVDTRLGHTILYDKLINKVSTRNIVSILHADMIIAPNYFENLLKHLKENTIISGTRIEPPIHPEGKEKIIQDFGIDYDTLKLNEFELFCQKQMNLDFDKTTQGIFAPWILYKEDFQNTQGHDPLFAPFGYEDSDIFQKWLLHGFKLIQSRDAFVYHLTCRGHRWSEKLFEDNSDYSLIMTNARKKFIRKWGCFVHNNEYQHPIIFPRYKKTLLLNSNNVEQSVHLLDVIEPFFDRILISGNFDIIKDLYLRKEKEKYNVDLSYKFIDVLDGEDIIITIEDKYINNTDIEYINYLPKIIEESGEKNSTFVLGNLKIEIREMKNYIDNLKTIKQNTWEYFR